MIKVNKKPEDAPDILDAKGKKETDSICTYFNLSDEDRENEKKPKCNVYNDKTVKKALGDLFNYKCAYCETRYSANQPGDVEHWRPKNAVTLTDGSQKKPGYYWLGASWDNLLPSCADCNRERTQTLLPTGETIVVGKKNRFPIEDENDRAENPGEEVNEKPLLLHPCVDEPSEHLHFRFDYAENPGEEFYDADGHFILTGIILPKTDGAGNPSVMGDTSISVYALHRSGLVNDRRERLLLIEKQMYTIRELCLMLEDLSDYMDNNTLDGNVGFFFAGIQDRIDRLLDYEINALMDFQKPDQPYSMMARYAIEEFRKTVTI